MGTDKKCSIEGKPNNKKENNKIGIVTFHCAENYGAYLQAFALQKWLQMRMSSGVDIKIINYRPAYLIRPYKIRVKDYVGKNISIIQKGKNIVIASIEIPYKLLKKRRFRQAERFLPLTKPYYSNEIVLDNSYKALVLGSDQIWNTTLTHGADPVFFGAIAGQNCKKISYAASVGVSAYPLEIKKEISIFLSQLSSIGVREKESVKILQPLSNCPIEVNVDPTLLIAPDIWNKYIHKVKYDNYILVYRVSADSRMLQDAYRVAKKYKKIILHFGEPSLKPIFPDVVVKSVAYCGPFDFISYISSASLILTDSFHATCFSIIFKKNFYTYLQKSRSERLRTLANIGEFNRRLLEYEETLTDQQLNDMFTSSIEEYSNKFIIARKQSEKYLLKELEGIK